MLPPYRMTTVAAGRRAEVWLALHLVLAVEALDAACSVHDVLLTREERMRSARDVEFDQWILVSVLPLDGLVGLHRRAGKEGKVCRRVLKNDVAIVWMDTVFHLNSKVRYSTAIFTGHGQDSLPRVTGRPLFAGLGALVKVEPHDVTQSIAAIAVSMS